MDLHQLKTFVTVAREGTITRASELLHLSQPAVSAHIKAIEDAVGLSLFERTPRGMALTREGERLLARAEQTLAAHDELISEATRIKGRLTGKLRLGAGTSSSHEAVGRLLTALSERCPDVDVALKHGASLEVLAGIRSGTLDAGFYNEAAEVPADLDAVEVARFRLHLVAPHGLMKAPPDWKALAEQPWIYPTASGCCGRTADNLFRQHGIRPRRIIDVDREELTRTLVASGVGVGLLHEDTAEAAQRAGEVDLLFQSPNDVRVLFAHLRSRAQDPLLAAANAILRLR